MKGLPLEKREMEEPLLERVVEAEEALAKPEVGSLLREELKCELRRQ